MRVKLVVNIFGGPGVGKSTIAAGLFFRLKCRHYDVELVDEYAKYLVYQNRTDVLRKDQVKVFAEQQAKLRAVAEHRKVVIVDSPLLLSKIYFDEKENLADPHLFVPLVVQMFNAYPNFNVYLVRNPELPYETVGRVQATLEEAMIIDERVKRFLDANSIPYVEVLAAESAVEVIYQKLLESGRLTEDMKIEQA